MQAAVPVGFPRRPKMSMGVQEVYVGSDPTGRVGVTGREGKAPGKGLFVLKAKPVTLWVAEA